MYWPKRRKNSTFTLLEVALHPFGNPESICPCVTPQFTPSGKSGRGACTAPRTPSSPGPVQRRKPTTNVAPSRLHVGLLRKHWQQAAICQMSMRQQCLNLNLRLNPRLFKQGLEGSRAFANSGSSPPQRLQSRKCHYQQTVSLYLYADYLRFVRNLSTLAKYFFQFDTHAHSSSRSVAKLGEAASPSMRDVASKMALMLTPTRISASR